MFTFTLLWNLVTNKPIPNSILPRVLFQEGNKSTKPSVDSQILVLRY